MKDSCIYSYTWPWSCKHPLYAKDWYDSTMFSVEHLLHQGLRGTGWTLLWLHWLALGHKGKTCAAGCWDDISRVIACHNRICIYIYFRKCQRLIGMQLFPGKTTCHFQVSGKKASSSTPIAKTLCPPHFLCQVSHLHVRIASAKHLQASRLLSGWRLWDFLLGEWCSWSKHLPNWPQFVKTLDRQCPEVFVDCDFILKGRKGNLEMFWLANIYIWIYVFSLGGSWG